MTVRINDAKEDRLAPKLGLSNEGYPNIVVYDAQQEYVGRVVGFGGVDSWFKEVKDAVAAGKRLEEAKAAAEKNPVHYADVAVALVDIPERTKDAKEALEKVPHSARKTKSFEAVAARVDAVVTWGEEETRIRSMLEGKRSREAVKDIAPKAIDTLDEWLKDHADGDAETTATALAKKGFFLRMLDRTDEAREIAKTLLTKYPTTHAATMLLNGLR